MVGSEVKKSFKMIGDLPPGDVDMAWRRHLKPLLLPDNVNAAMSGPDTAVFTIHRLHVEYTWLGTSSTEPLFEKLG